MADTQASALMQAGDCTVAMVGNPNTGKTTLFNALTGMSQKVGNYPGCTVEKKVGWVKFSDCRVKAIDLPGTYSLAALSPDEMVAADVIMGNMPGTAHVDAIVVVLDASNLHRNLYLLSQVMEFGLPTIGVLNMMDITARRKIDLHVGLLQERLGIPLFPVQGNTRAGLGALREALHPAAIGALPAPRHRLLPGCYDAAAGLAEAFPARAPELFRALIDELGYSEARLCARVGPDLRDRLRAVRAELGETLDLASLETNTRYQWIADRLEGAMQEPAVEVASFSDKLDRLLTHRVWGLMLFVALMTIVFQSIYSWAGPMIDGIEGAFAGLGAWAAGFFAEGMLQSLVVDGIIGGVGAVMVFIPQIAILFLFIALLEGCGYLARGAYLMDRLLAKFGLSGKSFIPLMSSFACAIPGVMAARTIENARDRLATILIAPLMSCSARLPVYVVLIGAFIPSQRILGIFNLQGLTLFGLYCVGVFAAIGVAFVFKRTPVKHEPAPFLMELPSYKVPDWRTVGHTVYTQSKAFFVKAGTIIFALTVVIWALGYFPRPQRIADEHEALRREAVAGFADDADRLEGRLKEIDSAEAGAYLRQSILGRAGVAIEPVVKPLGWDWKIGMAVIASFPAREVIIATLGTIYNLGGDHDEESMALRDHLRSATWPDGRQVFTVPVSLSIMVFFALCAQCMATLAVIRRETSSWRWPAITFVYMTALAYVGAFFAYRFTLLLGWG